MDNDKKIKSFTDLRAWKESHKLVLMVYQATKNFPKEELFSLTSQTKRAVISVTSNLAEGFSRNSLKEKIQFYYISKGSISELQSQLLIVKDLMYSNKEDFDKLAAQSVIASKLINGLIKYCKNV